MNLKGNWQTVCPEVQSHSHGLISVGISKICQLIIRHVPLTEPLRVFVYLTFFFN